MTNSTKTFEFTAFAVSDLGVGSRVNKGETFTMPGEATVCIEVSDNDSFLSGDSCHNENSNDNWGQQASITGENDAELGNGGQIYAESYYWVSDQNGNWYVMIEIEQENSSDDYVSFYTGGGYSVPPAGAELTVHSQCNVTGNWIDYKCIDAGEKVVEDPWSLNEDTCTYTIEAESWDLSGFHVVDGQQASGGELVKISGHDGKLSTDFGGTDGVYNMIICVQDECDGKSKLMVYVNGELQQTIKLDQQTDGGGSNNGGFSEVTLQGLEIAAGDTVEIRAWRDGNEFVRIDAIKFEQVKFEVCDNPDAINLGFDGFAAGDILGTQIDGVTISAMGGSGDAMIFDSQNPTGGDGDLETQVAQLGNVLIVSEDGDSSDPDDAIGGKISFEFDAPSSVFDLKVIDTEEGGTITLTLADGTTKAFDIPNLVNGGVGQVLMNVDEVVRMDVQLNGSGAIDDLCYVPGIAAEPLGSLSGRYFFDADRDGLDNDADNAIAGVTVELLDEDGNPVLDGGVPVTTVTDTQGNYDFGDLVAGTYGVKFTDTVDGRELTTQNVDADASDAIDSDAADIGGGMSVIENITVLAGQNTPNNDAGVVELLGALSGTYFCDDDRDGVDDGAAAGDADVAGKLVSLLDGNGDPVLDGNGDAITTVTNAEGNYRFDNLEAGEYKVMFEATEGKEFIAQDVGGDDTIDSDVDPDNGMTAPVAVLAGEETTDVDAGVQDQLGSLSGRYFCDDDEDGLDNDGADNGVEGVVVSLLDSNGAAVLDGNGNPRTATTDAQGNYAFTGLLAATYAVMFADAVSGKELTTQNVDGDLSDDIDSDASDLGGGTSLIENIVVAAGQNTPDNDAGVVEPNTAPLAGDDEDKTCADEAVTIDLLSNDSDPDGDIISVISISDADETVGVGGTLTLADGALATLNNDGTVTVDGSAAYSDLLIGEMAMDSFSYTLSDGDLTAIGAVEVEFCGAKNTLETIDASLDGATVTYIIGDITTIPQLANAWTLDVLSSTDGDIPLGSYTAAYCIDSRAPFDVDVLTTAEVSVATEANAAAVGVANADKIDSVNWLLNNDFTQVDNGDGTGDTYTDLEVQEAIWILLNGDTFYFDNPDFPGLVVDNQNGVRDGSEIATAENAMEIAMIAMVDGDEFEAGAGEIVGLILDPIDPIEQEQPFIIGVQFDALAQDCIC